MNQWFPKLREIDVRKDRNPNYLHSLWLAIWVPVVTLPEILYRALGQRLWELAGLYVRVLVTTGQVLLAGLTLLFFGTVGVFWNGLLGRLDVYRVPGR